MTTTKTAPKSRKAAPAKAAAGRQRVGERQAGVDWARSKARLSHYSQKFRLTQRLNE